MVNIKIVHLPQRNFLNHGLGWTAWTAIYELKHECEAPFVYAAAPLQTAFTIYHRLTPDDLLNRGA